jgi:hypothetical protein
VLVCWCGVLVCWCVGVLVCWCVGVLVCWCAGVLVCWWEKKEDLAPMRASTSSMKIMEGDLDLAISKSACTYSLLLNEGEEKKGEREKRGGAGE